MDGWGWARIRALGSAAIFSNPIFVLIRWFLGGFQRFHPVDWKDLDWSSKAARAFQADALEHGVGCQGLSIPIRGPKGQYALFTISHNALDEAWAGFIETVRRDLILIAHYFNKKILAIEA